MATSPPLARRRRRPRRGSLARPVNGGLYRASFLICALPLLLLAFTFKTPTPLPKPALPGAFDGTAALALTRDLATQYPDRAPGTPGAAEAATWFQQQLEPYGFRTATERWSERVPGLGVVPLQNLLAVAPGQSSEAIVVMAHRDDLGTGPGANDNASGTAALIELARAYAQPRTTSQGQVQSARTIIFLSTDGGAFGGVGIRHFIDVSPYSGRIVAVIDLDAIAGPGRPMIEIAGSKPRSPSPTLIATTVARIAGQTGKPPLHVGFVGQLIDLGFPFTLYEQGPLIANGISAIAITTEGTRPAPAFGDSVAALRPTTLSNMGLAAQQLLGSLDQGAEFGHGGSVSVYVSDGIAQGWAIELVLVGLLLPFLVAIVDLYALCRRHRVAFGPAVAALRRRLGFWAFVGLAFTAFRLAGAWPQGPAIPPNPATAIAGNWPSITLIALGCLVFAGWLIARRRLVPQRPVDAVEELAGAVVALAALLIVALLVVATNPFALLFVLPALHAWLWLPQLRIARPPVRTLLFLLGLGGPAILVISLALRFGLGLDAPWYLLELTALRAISPSALAIVLAGAAAASQLATIATGRYGPYPAPGAGRPQATLRGLVRFFVLRARAS